MTTTRRNLPSVTQDPTDPDFVRDPYAFYRDLRAAGELVLWTDYGFPMTTTLAATSQLMKHPQLGREVPVELKEPVAAGLEPFYAIEEKSLLELEPPDHTRIRRHVMPAFGRAQMARMAPRISQIADEIIDRFPEGEFDLIPAFTDLLPVRIIAHFLGIDEADAPKLKTWSNQMVAMYQARRDPGIEAAAAKASSEFGQYLKDQIARKRTPPGIGALDSLVQSVRDGHMTEDELVSTAILLLNAGHEATVHSLAHAVYLLADRDDRGTCLQPESIATTVEECLRYEPPLHMFTRYVYEPMTLFGHEFQRGDKIGCLLGCACRDDAVWPDGDRFDPFRIHHAHIAFGAGIHVCLGAALARIEMQIALPALFSRCPGLKITQPPRYSNTYHFRGIERLMVRVD